MKSLTLLLLAGLAVAAQEGGAEAAAGNATEVAQGNSTEAAQGGEANAEAGKENNNNNENNNEENNNQENNANDVIQVQNGQECVNLEALNDPKCVPIVSSLPISSVIRLTPFSPTASTLPRSTWATCR